MCFRCSRASASTSGSTKAEPRASSSSTNLASRSSSATFTQQMSAVVIALATPYYAISDARGDLSIPNVPPGRYQLQVFHSAVAPDALRALSREITVGPGANLDRNASLCQRPTSRSPTKTNTDAITTAPTPTAPPTQDRRIGRFANSEKGRAGKHAPFRLCLSLRLHQLVSITAPSYASTPHSLPWLTSPASLAMTTSTPMAAATRSGRPRRRHVRRRSAHSRGRRPHRRHGLAHHGSAHCSSASHAIHRNSAHDTSEHDIAGA